jgi:hypothetical protein
MMESHLKGCLKAIALELRHQLEGHYDALGAWQSGDLDRRLASMGVRRDRSSVPLDELPRLSQEDRDARHVVDAFIEARAEAGVDQRAAIAEFVAKSAYSWANRLLALRCMEARGLIDEVILQKDVYGGRSLQHNRLARKEPGRCTGEDEGLYDVLFDEFKRRAEELPLLFNPHAPEVALRPTIAVLKFCIGLLSGTQVLKGQEAATDELFTAPDTLGWTYQYWNTEEKDRVDEWLKTKEGFKCEGVDIIYKTALYTEPYMVKFLVQNSLGAIWIGMHPHSHLSENWQYYVRDADRAIIQRKPVAEITFLDPACGSGHFLFEAFDLLYEMYVEEGVISEPAQICASILERNLYGIDIDERAIQIAALALVMKAKEKAPGFVPRRVNLVATNIHLPSKKEHLDAFLAKHPEDVQLKPALLVIFEMLAHADELGALLQIEEPVEKELRNLQAKYEASGSPAEQAALWREMQKPVQGKLPAGVESYEAWKERTLARIRQHFQAEAAASDLSAAFFGEAGAKGVSLVDLLSRRYDVVAANPPYLGSQNMGPLLKRHIQRHFVGAKRDLYAAFILRCLQLCGSGRTAMVTQQSWMFLKQMRRVRAAVFAKHCVEILGHLGPGAFEEISGAHVNVALFVIAATPPHTNHHLTALRPSWDTSVARRSLDLADAATKPNAHSRFRVLQSSLVSLPLQPFVYWCSNRYLELLRSSTNYEETSEVGYTASANQRFVRFHWETPATSRWRRYSKGGGFRRWTGLDWYVVDWNTYGERPSAYVLDHYPADKYSLWMKSQPTTTSTIVWSEVGSGAMGARLCAPGSVISRTGPGVLDSCADSRLQSLAFLNCRVSTYLLRLACSGLHFAYPYVAKLHRPAGDVDPTLVELAVRLGEYLATVDLCERDYAGHVDRLRQLNAVAATLSVVEGVLDEQATACFGLEEQDRKAVDDDVGINAGSLPVIAGHDSLPTLPSDISLPPALLNALARLPRLSAENASVISPVVYTTYAEVSGDRSVEVLEPTDLADPDESDEDQQGGEAEEESIHAPMPAANSIEAVARHVGINPLSVYWILQNRSSENTKERAVQFENCLSVAVLRIMGHRWRGEIEHGSSVPACAESGGIVPITDCPGTPSLLVRVRERIAEDFGVDRLNTIEQELREITGKPLGLWLATGFFPLHISHFKKRPIVWHIESARSNWKRGRRATANAQPAFSCLLYYHRLDTDLLPKLRSQYVGPLRQGLQTELADLERLSKRTADQDERRVQIEMRLEELKDFDARLQHVVTSGFASSVADAIGAKEALDTWTSRDGQARHPVTQEEFLAQESRYDPDLNDGVRVNIAPLQKAGLLASDVLAAKDVEKAIADRAEWRADERRWCREGKLPQPGWWPSKHTETTTPQVQAEVRR